MTHKSVQRSPQAKEGLHGEVDQRSFERLCDNRHPETGERLTARTRKDRRAGYDFNFHVSKSVSLLYALTGDTAIVTAFRRAVADTMRDIEAGVTVRVRKGGRYGERVSGNALWAEFVHFTARPVKGVIDPHLHAHLFLLNVSFDPTEGIWKAVDVAGVKSQGMRYQTTFQRRFARALSELGYPVAWKGEAFEIVGFERATIEKFSGRTAQVETYAKAHGITDPTEKDRIGARTRERKRKETSMAELRREWEARLTDQERSAIAHASCCRNAWPGREAGGDHRPMLLGLPERPQRQDEAAWRRERLNFLHQSQQRTIHGERRASGRAMPGPAP